VNQHRFLDGFEDGQELSPNLPLVLDGVRPQAVLDSGFAVADAQADEVVEIAVGQALDIQIDGRAFDLEFPEPNPSCDWSTWNLSTGSRSVSPASIFTGC